MDVREKNDCHVEERICHSSGKTSEYYQLTINLNVETVIKYQVQYIMHVIVIILMYICI